MELTDEQRLDRAAAALVVRAQQQAADVARADELMVAAGARLLVEPAPDADLTDLDVDPEEVGDVEVYEVALLNALDEDLLVQHVLGDRDLPAGLHVRISDAPAGLGVAVVDLVIEALS